jgi:virginiamycin B lyase
MLAGLALTGCGGGGTAAPKPAAAPATVVPQRTAIATGSLTLRFPPGYTRALGVARKKAPASATRRPAYVNPIGGNLLDIYVGGQLVLNLDGVTPDASVTISPSPAGTQTISNVPLYSTTSDVTAIEWDSSDSNILALGELPSVSVTAGGMTALTLTMQMNANGFAIAAGPTGASGTELNAQHQGLGTAGSPFTVYIYPTDPLGGYTTAAPSAGVGGLPTNLTVTTSANDGSRIGAGVLGFLLSYASSSSQVPITVTATNPANFINNTASYPELNALYQANSSEFATLGAVQDTATMTLLPGPAGFHEFALPTQNAGSLYTIVSGPDGNLWGVENGASKIFKMTTSGVATEYSTPTSSSAPIAIVSASDGNLWFDEFNGNNVASIVPGTGAITEYALPTFDSGPVAMGSSAASGKVWVVDYACSANELTTFTPGPSPAFTQYSIPQGCAAPNGMAFDGLGNAWFFEQNGNFALNSSPGGIFSGTVALSGGPVGIATGSDGNLWITESSNDVIAQVTPGGALTEYPLPSIGGSAGASPTGIARGPGGTMWFTEPGINAIGRLTFGAPPSVTEFVIPTSNVSPDGITTGPDGNIWWTEDAGNARSWVGTMQP